MAQDVKCYYHRGKSDRYSLKKVDTNIKGKMGVFGWVEEKRGENKFEILTYKTLGDKYTVADLVDRVVQGMHYVSKREDAGEATGIVFCIQKGSMERDYQKAVQVNTTIIHWSAQLLPEELGDITGLAEGAIHRVTINAYERNPVARWQCIEHHG